ncbi:MAG: choice-of-anchor Q domain-containing protein, partial [Anaerolineae bacterium]
RGSTENCVIINNTFFHNDSLQDGNGELYIQFDTVDNVIKNNIFAANAQSLFISNAYTQNSGSVVDYNLYFAPAGENDSEWQWKDVYYQGFAAYRTATGNDAHSLFADPSFLSAAAPDLHLQPSSPAIDSGETLAEAGSVDFDGRSRTQNGITDIGAFEGPLILDKFIYLALVTVN